MKKAIFTILTFLASSILFAQNITGQWNGVLKAPGIQLRIVFHINKTDNGYSATMDSPDQGAKGIPVTSTSFNQSVLKLAVANIQIEYEGTLGNDSNIVGNFKQGGSSFPMNLSKEIIEQVVPKSEPEYKDTNLIETPMVLHTKSGNIFGTLTTPKKQSKTPVALIIAGSGPTDRNGNILPVLKSDAYKKLAHGLADNNISSLRFDKRGIGESKMISQKVAELRFEDYINDAKDWIQLLKQDKRFSKIIVIGHSEGSLIGMMAATNADKFISIAGPGQSIDKTLKEQLAQQPKALQDSLYPIIDSLLKGKIVNNVSPQSMFNPSVQPYLISWFKYNPQIEIQKLKLPILIIQGTSDIQVSVEDAKRLSKANPTAKMILIDKMNHIFKTVNGDRQANLATYNNPSLPLANLLVADIVKFIMRK